MNAHGLTAGTNNGCESLGFRCQCSARPGATCQL